MEAFLNKVAEINGSVNGVVWGIFGLTLLIGTGVIVTLATKVFQITHLKLWWKNTIGSLFTKNVMKHRKEKGTISPFQALCTALAATVGTGNIAGVAAAICIGGAGAVFWMWVAAFFGMMTNYAENVLGIYFRRKNSEGEWSGGAMYYLQDGVGSYSYKDKHGEATLKRPGRILAVLFCIFTMTLRDSGAHNINLVTPTHYTLPLRRLLERIKPTLGIPVVWNSGGYEDPEMLRTLEGLVDVYLPDMKYYSSALSLSYSGVADYYPTALAALNEMLRQQPQAQFNENGLLLCGTVVRHLVLPGSRADSVALLEALARDVGTDRFLLSLMSQYTKEFAMDTPYRCLHRSLTTFEYSSVLDRAAALGFQGFSQSRNSATPTFTPNFSEE